MKALLLSFSAGCSLLLAADPTSQWFTTGVFRTAKEATFDFSLHKTIPITEKLKLQYRAEFFNIANHPILGNPGTTVTSGGFDRITSAGAPRVIQMALKLNF